MPLQYFTQRNYEIRPLRFHAKGTKKLDPRQCGQTTKSIPDIIIMNSRHIHYCTVPPEQTEAIFSRRAHEKQLYHRYSRASRALRILAWVRLSAGNSNGSANYVIVVICRESQVHNPCRESQPIFALAILTILHSIAHTFATHSLLCISRGSA